MTLTKDRFKLVGNPGNIWLDCYLLILLSSSVIGYLSVRSLTNVALFLLLIPALIQLRAAYRNAQQSGSISLIKPVAITLALPVLALLVSQVLREEWIVKAYDGPSRMLLSIPLIFYFAYKRVDFARLLGLSAPLALLILVPLVHLHPDVLAKWGGRFSTTFVDPDTFGFYTLILTAFCLFSIGNPTSLENANVKIKVLQLAGLAAGFYLNIGSATRGSWIAIPALALLYLVLNGKTVRAKSLIAAFILMASASLLIAHFLPNSLVRLQSGYYELSSWFNGSNRDTSAGLRLTMWQMSWEFFKHSPLYGYGDLGFRAYLNEDWITSIASPLARETIFNGPHNEFLANLLRSGIWGGVSAAALFFVPFILFWRHRLQIEAHQACHLGLAFIVCLSFNSLSGEVFTLKYTASFYGLMIAGLTAQIAWVHAKQRGKNDGQS